MRLFIPGTFILLLCCLSGIAQNGYWYNLRSTQLLSAQEGKEIVVVIRNQQNVIRATYNQKINCFSVHAESELNLENIIHQLNASGYYVADITKDAFHNEIFPYIGFNYQAALLYCYSVEKFEESGIVKIALSDEEYGLLTSNQQAIMNTCPYFFHID